MLAKFIKIFTFLLSGWHFFSIFFFYFLLKIFYDFFLKIHVILRDTLWYIIWKKVKIFVKIYQKIKNTLSKFCKICTLCAPCIHLCLSVTFTFFADIFLSIFTLCKKFLGFLFFAIYIYIIFSKKRCYRFLHFLQSRLTGRLLRLT